MSPQSAKIYIRLFAALSLSVLANLLLFQPRLADNGGAGPIESRVPQSEGNRTAAGGLEPKAMRLGFAVQKLNPNDESYDTVRSIQRELKDLGHYPGQIDGRISQITHAAIFAYQQQYGLAITAEPSEQLLKTLILGRADGGPLPGGSPTITPGSAAEKLVADIRRVLTSLGYNSGRADGRFSPELARAIRSYEADNHLLPPTGRISATLILHLQRKAAAPKVQSG